ncbi:hypothetical protein [Halarcobacter anaerophilus]|uniref:hypothetical protein n=1 Tax=Halarcobacter anaerophilus TaxID=877500 RepID=UPI0005CAE125|nr:hypothetical protein [Halarcobacter anaerophilus]
MILNLSQIKTEALLLFCKDLIESYINKDDIDFNIDKEINSYINKTSHEFLKQLKFKVFPNDYYMKNRNHYRIKAVLKAYNFINKELDKELKKGKLFNPSMLYFSLLAVWFKELNKEANSKQYIYFTIYPYTNVYDKLLINIKDENFKLINIAMLEIAEKVILKLDKISFK